MYVQSRLLWTFARNDWTFLSISFEWKWEIPTWLFNLQPHHTNLNFKLRHLQKRTSSMCIASSLSMLHLYHPFYFGFFIRCHLGKNKELYCFGLEGAEERKPERAIQWSKMGKNVVARTYVSSAGRLLEPGSCFQSSHLLPCGAKRSRRVSVDTVKSFIFFMVTEKRICLSSCETPFVHSLQVFQVYWEESSDMWLKIKNITTDEMRQFFFYISTKMSRMRW